MILALKIKLETILNEISISEGTDDCYLNFTGQFQSQKFCTLQKIRNKYIILENQTGMLLCYILNNCLNYVFLSRLPFVKY